MSKKLMAKFPGVDKHTGSKSKHAGPGQMAFGHYSASFIGKSGLADKPVALVHGVNIGPVKQSPTHPIAPGGKKPRTGPG